MIVAPCFDDDSVEVAWLQHDVYGQALDIIVRECRDSARQAAAILGLASPPCVEGDLTYDHRTLQDAHDLLAAAWRYRANAAQRELDFKQDVPARDTDLMDRWLRWLTDEVRSWRDPPTLAPNDAVLVRSVILILQNQATPIRRQYEENLLAGLAWRFSDVPWLQQRLDLHERVMARTTAAPSLYGHAP